MRVDFVITELYVGGAERCLTELAIGLAETGDDVRVFSLASLPDGQQSELVDRLQLPVTRQRVLVDRLLSAGIPVESGGADSPTKLLSAYWKLRNWFDLSKPDVSQFFLHHANVLGTFAAKASGVQTRIGGLRVAEAKRLRCHIERSALKRMQGVVCVSEAVQQFARDRLGCDADRSVVIPNGVDVTRFASASPMKWSDVGWPEDSIVSLFVGRLHPQKGISLLQEQIDQIAPAGSNRRLLLVGDGPLRSDVESWSNRIGRQRVQLLPWQSDIAPLIRACRVLLLPSHYEGMPNVVLEAMAAARPVVCSRVEGSKELLSHAADQQSFPAGDSNAMKNLVEQFLSDETLCDEVGELNQLRARKDFSIAAMVDAYRSYYRTLLTRRLDSE